MGAVLAPGADGSGVFQELGIDRRRLRLCGCGDVQPHRVAPDTPPREAAAADRRVEIVDTGEYVR